MENSKKIQEIQTIEQNIQNLLLQKQAFQMELAETQSALKEIENSGEEVFKIIGQLMVKTDKSNIKKELENKNKILELRINTIEKQESTLSKKIEDLRKDLIK
jgi:prefoldin beta subunit